MSLKTITLAMLLPLSMGLVSCDSIGGHTESVEARENIMKNWADAKEIMQKMIENPDTFDAVAFREQAQFLADNADTPWQHFDDANDKHHATDAVWTDAAGFRQAADAYQHATAELNAVAQTATTAEQVAPAFKEVGKNCGGCHKIYKAD